MPRAESSGVAAFRACSDWGRGRRAWDRGGAGGGGPEADGGRRGKFQDRGHQQRRSGLRGPESQGRAEEPPRALLGTSAHAAPHQPPAQPVTRSVTRSRPRPPAAPPEPQYLQISPGQRLAPLRACPPPSPVALPGPRRPTLLAARPRTAAPVALTPFLCCRTFGGGEGERGKVGRRGPRDPVCDRGAGSDRRPWSCRRCGPGRQGLGPAASAALGLLLLRELAGAAHSSTGRCAAHPDRAAAARPPDTPPRRLRAPVDTPPSRPRAWPLSAPRPSAPWLDVDSWPAWRSAWGEPHLIRPDPHSRLTLIKGAEPTPCASFFYKQIAKVPPSLPVRARE